MAARTFVVDAGGVSRLWKAARAFVVDAGGVTRALQRAFVVDAGGVARQIYQAATYSLPTGASDAGTFGVNTVQAQIQFNSAGTWQQGNDDAPAGQGTGNWVTPTSLAPGAYTIRASVASSDGGTLGGAVDTDLALTSNRLWTLEAPSANAFTTTLTLTLKDGGGNTVATGSATLVADATL